MNLMNNVGTGVNKIKSFNDREAVIIGWGSIFLDYDNDSDLDLFNSNGPINPLVNPIPNTLFENKGRVYELNEKSGVMDYGIARGSIHFDYDNDGDQDIFVVNQRPSSSHYNQIIYATINYIVHNSWYCVKINGPIKFKWSDYSHS